MIGDTVNTLLQQGGYLMVGQVSYSSRNPYLCVAAQPWAAMYMHVGIYQVFGTDFSNGAGPRQSPEKQV